MLRLVQIKHPKRGRQVAIVNGKALVLVAEYQSVFELALAAIALKTSLKDLAQTSNTAEELNYDHIYNGESEWRLLPPFDHPHEAARCLITGTGLTHEASAENRQAMHSKADAELTDSMKIYRWGVEGGRPAAGTIGASPEWFYKGNGTILRAHNETLDIPNFADDGGEEAEVAGAYLVDPNGIPRRVGFMVGNEFSDHIFEKKNYLYLAHSKLRTCSIGPEIVVGGGLEGSQGTVKIERAGTAIWCKPFNTGESNMCHTVTNLEHHHFKYPAHRRAGDAHIHFLGADVFSFGDGIALQDGDVTEIQLEGFGRPLRNPIRIDKSKPQFVGVEPL
ncbi:MAG: hypothetical protein JWO95_2486 [Verrucomicrobiales bacterium]|nr:hypothetical protein [Verrucomicrobiales bacterium]